jgi:two-component system chemotaxis response regulator CheY
VISALADKLTAIDAIDKGACGFLCKPFTERQLNDALRKLIER